MDGCRMAVWLGPDKAYLQQGFLKRLETVKHCQARRIGTGLMRGYRQSAAFLTLIMWPFWLEQQALLWRGTVFSCHSTYQPCAKEMRKASLDKQEGCHTFRKDTCLTDGANGGIG